MAYVYRHIRLDKNIPFYIGIGKNDTNYSRAYSKKNRNFHWNNIVNVSEYEVEIILDNIPWEHACEKEKEFIELYKKSINGGFLCNIADGGQGGFISKEANEKRKKSLLGHIVSEETKNKLRLKAKGRKASEETKLKMSLIHKQNKTGSWIKTKGADNGNAFPVYQYDLDGNFIKKWDCARYAVIELKLSRAAITNCIKNRQKLAGGFTWKKQPNQAH
jgi:hypothetical protein